MNVEVLVKGRLEGLEMAQQLSAVKRLCRSSRGRVGPDTHIRWLTAVSNVSSRGPLSICESEVSLVTS